MARTRYPQLCALARAAEVIGERWTLLIVRELLLGPRRFTDLRERLDGVSASVLAERLLRLEETGVIARRFLEPPAASMVYELTATGRALEPAMHELLRWGARFMLPARPKDRVEAEWLRLALTACARKSGTPNRSFLLRLRRGRGEMSLRVAGGTGGTVVTEGAGPADATVIAEPRTVLALMSGAMAPRTALRDGAVRVEGDISALDEFPALFDVSVTA
ncbi:MAG TPA: winged helix-turn-helix transcriptional regulator [Candidatus Limnocylindria bacterium]|nr:winged helix-turn-helix transcriptional regulator [Candidatus Limnocylindria bacterium]